MVASSCSSRSMIELGRSTTAAQHLIGGVKSLLGSPRHACACTAGDTSTVDSSSTDVSVRQRAIALRTKLKYTYID